MGTAIFKRTNDLSKSQPRMTSAWTEPGAGRSSFKGGQYFEVPLHDNNEEYGTVSTGLIQEQPDLFPPTFVTWISGFTDLDPDLPEFSCPDHCWTAAVGGCPLSQGLIRNYYLEVGEYFLHTQTASYIQECGDFNVKMKCSEGATTALPAESDPLGFSVNAETGQITGTPERARDFPYKMRLRAVDAADRRTTLSTWSFNVKQAQVFSINPLTEWNAERDGKLATAYHLGETHLLPKPRLQTKLLLQHPANGDFDKVVYLFSATAAAGNSNCSTVDQDGKAVNAISALTDVATGEAAINIQCQGSYTATLVVRDGAGVDVAVRKWAFEVFRRYPFHPTNVSRTRAYTVAPV